jgi:rod shape-determining protein MreB and related proteins
MCYNSGQNRHVTTANVAGSNQPTAGYDRGSTLAFNPLNSMLGAFSRDLGIDLGTANTLVHVRGKGIVISEPSVVAIDKKTKIVKAVGAEAKAMVGKTPANIIAVRPLKDGVIADFDVVEKMIKHFIGKAHDRSLGMISPRPRVVVGVPSGVTQVEMRAARDAALNANAREAYVVEEPMAAAIGAGLPVDEPMGSMIVDIGGGTTEVAVISLGGLVINKSIRTAGDEIDEAIIAFARREYNLLVGERMAEKVKIAAGSAYPLDEEIKVVIRGRDMLTGLPKAVEVSSVEVREGIAGPVNTIVAEVRAALEETPPELVADIMEHGIVLAGGGALLHGLDRRITAETKMPVHIAQDPLSCVARGAGKMVEEFQNPVYRDILTSTQRGRRVKY